MITAVQHLIGPGCVLEHPHRSYSHPPPASYPVKTEQLEQRNGSQSVWSVPPTSCRSPLQCGPEICVILDIAIGGLAETVTSNTSAVAIAKPVSLLNMTYSKERTTGSFGLSCPTLRPVMSQTICSIHSDSISPRAAVARRHCGVPVRWVALKALARSNLQRGCKGRHFPINAPPKVTGAIDSMCANRAHQDATFAQCVESTRDCAATLRAAAKTHSYFLVRHELTLI